MAVEGCLHDAALHALASSVNEAHLSQPCIECGEEVFLDDGGNFPWSEGVKVDLGLYR